MPASNPSYNHRVAARSHPEIVTAIERAASRLGASRAITFRGRKVSAEAIINALLMNALALPEEELDRAIAEGIARYEKLLGGADEKA
jgi:hypothetical protein